MTAFRKDDLGIWKSLLSETISHLWPMLSILDSSTRFRICLKEMDVYFNSEFQRAAPREGGRKGKIYGPQAFFPRRGHCLPQANLLSGEQIPVSSHSKILSSFKGEYLLLWDVYGMSPVGQTQPELYPSSRHQVDGNFPCKNNRDIPKMIL